MPRVGRGSIRSPPDSLEFDFDLSRLNHFTDQIEALCLIPGCVCRFFAEFPVGAFDVQIESRRGMPLTELFEINLLGSLYGSQPLLEAPP